jgi:hypothetical protein
MRSVNNVKFDIAICNLKFWRHRPSPALISFSRKNRRGFEATGGFENCEKSLIRMHNYRIFLVFP